MARSGRLLGLLQVLRTKTRAARAVDLASELGVSVRTLYRDIATLRAEGASIDGEAGVGYLLREGFLLPPMMLTLEEIEAVRLGLQWVKNRGGEVLREPAQGALAKIVAVLPPSLRSSTESPVHSHVSPSGLSGREDVIAALHRAIRAERRVTLVYCSSQGDRTERVVWPFLLGYYADYEVLAAWCETRQAFRHFRTDRILRASALAAAPPRSRQDLLRQWQSEFSITDDLL